jgi:hypothetical protein
MLYNISSPNTTIDSIQMVTPYIVTFDGLILLFTITIILTIFFVICIKKLI